MTLLTSGRRGFTLIELLTVIAIVGILLVLAIPAFNSLGKASKMQAGVRQISNALNLARQYAITHRTTTRVVFPHDATGSRPEWAYRAFSIIASNRTLVEYTRQNGLANPGTFCWEYISKWEVLPEGIVLSNSVNTLLGPEAFPFPGTSNTLAGTLTYIQFGPTGAAFSSDRTKRQIFLGEGFILGTTSFMASNSSNSSMVATATVDNLIGRVTISRP